MPRLLPGSLIVLTVLGATLAGCGSTRSSADHPLTVGGLTPTTQDPEAGLVAVTPGFDVTKYKIIAVEKFPVTDPDIQDDGDRRFAAKMNHAFQVELVRRLRESGLFQQVINLSDGELTPTAGPVLRLRGSITRLGRGSQVARYFAGLYGAGKTRAQTDMNVIEVPGNRVVIATADRRVASMGLFGGSDEEHLQESFDDIARDFATFLVRLSKGEMPKTVK